MERSNTMTTTTTTTSYRSEGVMGEVAAVVGGGGGSLFPSLSVARKRKAVKRSVFGEKEQDLKNTEREMGDSGEQLVTLLFEKGMISLSEKLRMESNMNRDKIRGALLDYDARGSDDLQGLATCLQGLVSFDSKPDEVDLYDTASELSESDWETDMEGFIVEDSEGEEEGELRNGSSGEPTGKDQLTEVLAILETEKEEGIEFRIDSKKLSKDAEYREELVKQVLEKNLHQKKKRQRRLEAVWNYVTNNLPPPHINEELFSRDITPVSSPAPTPPPPRPSSNNSVMTLTDNGTSISTSEAILLQL